MSLLSLCIYPQLILELLLYSLTPSGTTLKKVIKILQEILTVVNYHLL